MNALNLSPAPQREQTMEEILASIRKIIESNEALAGPLDAPAAPAAPVLQAVAASPAEPAPAAAVAPHAGAIAPLAASGERLVSESPEKRVAAAFDDLNLAFLRAKAMPSEQGVEAMLKPMLQDWLDNNLPGIVERLVREEIARIARGDI